MEKKYYAVLPIDKESVTTISTKTPDVLAELFEDSVFYLVENPDEYVDALCDFVLDEENLTITFSKNKAKVDDAQKNYNRNIRASILSGFDLWEKAVIRGREEESEEIMQWYNDILDLKPEAFENIPDKIKYYMGGK